MIGNFSNVSYWGEDVCRTESRTKIEKIYVHGLQRQSSPFSEQQSCDQMMSIHFINHKGNSKVLFASSQGCLRPLWLCWMSTYLVEQNDHDTPVNLIRRKREINNKTETKERKREIKREKIVVLKSSVPLTILLWCNVSMILGWAKTNWEHCRTGKKDH